MTVLLLMAAGGLAGGLGALLGIGGGIVLVPVLVLGFGIPMEQAVPASLMCVVANSCAAAASYVENKLSDIRLGLTLELATVLGAIVGGLVAAYVAEATVAIVFGLFTLYVALQMLLVRAPRQEPMTAANYVPSNYPLGISGSFVAGGLSALLGVGGGPLKVPLMAYGMRVPFKVASATSNLMIGVTGAASVAAYAWRGHLDLTLVSPLVVGVLGGAVVGSRLMPKVPTAVLKKLFAGVLLGVAGQMLWKGGAGLWPSVLR
ncbi:sulfite exporter TauE/SafE family protein [Corallococcus sp. H22C18031201]|uniref:sulfite exporter TauE/SafE family protein n=1 Tax=Citreicoccus inhibens TaxID=2849499 RepID=UPI000E76589C|nr:sulfite exporter TauE/SafE family protein [Citreicoccus inhibens]MBJ6762052.1 sulfite exporter TauE/SafE family protein [Myxococcaceae bacterium JPH2]MBU8897583.1 sulfite exporter TauE/SafE family protein [Citreicoccus inhibens]RJS19267.1 sulfite exporter TauE/SafE family protein [Corallococcus sp. H22C18031201]